MLSTHVRVKKALLRCRFTEEPIVWSHTSRTGHAENLVANATWHMSVRKKQYHPKECKQHCVTLLHDVHQEMESKPNFGHRFSLTQQTSRLITFFKQSFTEEFGSSPNSNSDPLSSCTTTCRRCSWSHNTCNITQQANTATKTCYVVDVVVASCGGSLNRSFHK